MRKESMLSNGVVGARTVFGPLGLRKTIALLCEEIRELYLADQIPWVVGYSGGKDSTAVLQLVWLAIRDLDASLRTKPIHIISTDTLVENPVVAAWVKTSLGTMRQAAKEQNLPLESHRLTPEVKDTFWVNLIGKGYPAPRTRFRWCTERLKINPSNAFIRRVVQESGEAILVLGTRKAESVTRARVMNQLEKERMRDRLSPNASLPNSLVYSPIEDWSNDEVWMFLMQYPNPWGYNNKELMSMYAGASADNECPLVVDTGTPSCGDSRFGCWVCTLVEQDKSMQAMIRNDEEKEWMEPLLMLRNELDQNDHQLRDFRRMGGFVQLQRTKDEPVPGPYTQSSRETWLRKVLEVEQIVRRKAPPEIAEDLTLITLEELHEIRRIWVFEKHEIEDSLPHIYQEVRGDSFPGQPLDENFVFGAAEMRILRELCGSDLLQFQLIRELLNVEQQHRSMARRAGLFGALEKAFHRSYYLDQNDAVERARRRREALVRAGEGDYAQLGLHLGPETKHDDGVVLADASGLPEGTP